MSRRLPYLRLLAFVLVGLVATALVAFQVTGAQPISGSFQVTVDLPDAGGLVPQSEVTYRGTPIGSVHTVAINPDGTGVRLGLQLNSAYQIPADTRAVVSMDVPIAIEHLDLQPPSAAGPFLHDGSVITAANTALPVPFDQLLLDGTTLLGTLNTQDLGNLDQQLATAFAGIQPDLRTLLDNSSQFVDSAGSLAPQILDLSQKGQDVLGSGAPLASQLPALAASLRGMTTQLTQLTPQAGQLIDAGQQALAGLIPLLNSNAKGVAALLANFGTLTTALDTRIPALTATLGSTAQGLNSFASIFVADTDEPGVTDARGTLVTTLGPVCYYGTPRRTPQQVGPRPVQAGWSCVGDQQYLQQRGSVNAPMPGNGSTPTVTPPAAGTGTAPQVPAGGQLDSWTSILTVGGATR